MSAGAVDRQAKVSIPVNAVIDDDIRPGHSAIEPTTSSVPASGRASTVASSLRCQVEREGNSSDPVGLRVQEAPDTPITLTMRVHDSGSKMVKQVPCLRRRCRWPQSGLVPEVPSGALRWAS